MSTTRHLPLAVILLLVTGGFASAQVLINPLPPVTAPPPPTPPPPPAITVPAVPKMNSPPPFELQNTAPGTVTNDPPNVSTKPLRHRTSFGARVERCLNDSTAASLPPTQRAEYSRACANGQ